MIKGLVEQLDQITLYHTFAHVNATRVVAGLLFESLGHARLLEGTTLTLRPMIKSQWRTLFHRKSQGKQWLRDERAFDGNGRGEEQEFVLYVRRHSEGEVAWRR